MVKRGDGEGSLEKVENRNNQVGILELKGRTRRSEKKMGGGTGGEEAGDIHRLRPGRCEPCPYVSNRMRKLVQLRGGAEELRGERRYRPEQLFFKWARMLEIS